MESHSRFHGSKPPTSQSFRPGLVFSSPRNVARSIRSVRLGRATADPAIDSSCPLYRANGNTCLVCFRQMGKKKWLQKWKKEMENLVNHGQ